MTGFGGLFALATLYSSAAIAAASPANNAFWVPFAPYTSSHATISSKLSTAPVVTQVPAPSGAPVLSPGWNLALPNPDGRLTNPLIYPIPDTEKTISFTSINSPLPDALVMMCFLEASNSILNSVIRAGRDGFIENGRFTAQSQNGTTNYVAITVQNQILTGQKVTYGTLAIVLRGLGQFMMAQDSFFEATFNIYDGHWGQVGYGSIIGGNPGTTA